ncbi:MAG: hypothetical protein L0216_02065 [Planctomycetales bacterium]|nr:hypothetical protein [Planctomycetales bacterium]
MSPRAPDGPVFGVDFSGARDAGRRIWVARLVLADALLRIDTCVAAADLPGGGEERDRALAALRDLIARTPGGTFGLDFPFGVHRDLVLPQGNWREFVLGFPERYPTPDKFRESCLARAQGRELARLSDREWRTPWSPYNIRLYKQTWHGIAGLLHPLVREGAASVLPMLALDAGKPAILEVCPSSTLRREGIAASYKGRTPEHLEARELILRHLREHLRIEVPDPVAARVVEDAGGDALDSILGAWAAFRALADPATYSPEVEETHRIEGRVYV